MVGFSSFAVVSVGIEVESSVTIILSVDSFELQLAISNAIKINKGSFIFMN